MDAITRIEKLEQVVARQAETIAKQAALIEQYIEQLRLAKCRQFGVSCEKSDDDIRQLNLFSELFGLETKPPKEPEIEEVTYSRKKRKGKREADLSGLPVERINHELPEDQRVCPDCGNLFPDIGVTIRKELKVISARVVVVEHATHAYKECDCPRSADELPTTSIVRAESPTPLIDGSLASASLVAYIIVQKYLNGLPLYRIENGFVFDGITISRQTMCNWVIKCVEAYLITIYKRLIAFLLLESVLHADETTLQVLRELGRKAQTKSYEWIYRTSGCAEHPIIIYDYKQTRKADHPKKFLAGFNGYLHTDGYQGYHDLHSGIIIVGFSTFAFGESRATRVRESSRCELAARSAGFQRRPQNNSKGEAGGIRRGAGRRVH